MKSFRCILLQQSLSQKVIATKSFVTITFHFWRKRHIQEREMQALQEKKGMLQ